MYRKVWKSVIAYNDTNQSTSVKYKLEYQGHFVGMKSGWYLCVCNKPQNEELQPRYGLLYNSNQNKLPVLQLDV